jgi:hypothetical protein
MAGVRLATGYIEISAETSRVPQQIKDALNQAGTAAAKPAGTQMGKDISQGIQDGLKTAPSGSGGSVISDVIAGKTIGGNVRTQGQKVGKELGTGLNQGVTEGLRTAPSGGGAGSVVTDIVQGKPVSGSVKTQGQKVGKDIGAGMNQGIHESVKADDAGIKEAFKDWGKGFTDQLIKGDVKKVFADIKTDLGGLGSSIGKVFTGGDVKTQLEGLTGSLTKVEDLAKNLGVNLHGIPGAVGGLADEPGLKNLATSLQSINDGLGGFDAKGSGLEGALGRIGGKAGDAANRVIGLKEALELLGQVDWNKFPGATGVDEFLNKGPGDLGTQIRNWLHDQGINLPDLGKATREKEARDKALAAGTPVGQGIEDYPLGFIGPIQPGTKRVPGGARPLLPGEPTVAPWGPNMYKYWYQGGERPPGFVDPGTGFVSPAAAPPPAAARMPSFAETIGGAHGAAVATIQAARADISANIASLTAGSVTVSGGGAAAAVAASPAYSQGRPTWWSKQTGGGIGGSGPVPIIAHGGEHVLTADDVQAAGGQDAVSAWRNALHYDDGGEVKNQQWLKDAATKAGMTPDQYVAAMAHTPPAQPGMAGPGNMPLDQQQSDMHQNLLGQGTDQAGQNIAALSGSDRTGGFVPVGAGSKAVAGTSFVSGLLNLGNEAVGGLIDTGAEAAQAAAAVGGFGAGGAAAGPAIQLGASEAKRAVSYGFQMAGILADAGIEQLFGVFGGAPRWLGYDYTQFIPNINTGDIGTTTLEKAMGASKDGKQAPGQQPGGPVTPEHLPGEQPVGPPVPKFGDPSAQQPALGGLAQTGQGAQAGDIKAGLAAGLAAGGVGAPPPAPGSASPAPAPPPQGGGGNLLQGLIPGFGMDEGGMLPHNSMAINTSGRPELVLSPQQLDAMGTSGNKNPYSRGGDTINITAVDAQDVAKEIDKRKRLAMLQYSGRP